MGFFYSALFSHVFHIQITPVFVLLNIVLSYLPDTDVPVELLQRGRLGGREHGSHRGLTHYPILYLVTTTILYFVLGSSWAVIFFVNTFTHLLLDSFGSGWGLKWFWPVSTDQYKLFTNKEDNSFAWTELITHWTTQEFSEKALKYGDDNWFRNLYFKPTRTLAFELITFLIGLLSLVWYSFII